MLRRTIRLLLIAMVLVGAPLTAPALSHAGENSWTTTGPYGVQISGLYTHPANDQVMFATVYYTAPPVYKSTDGRVTWQPSSTGLPSAGTNSFNNSHGMAFDKDDPNTLYLGMYNGVYVSRNAGATWEHKASYVENGQPHPLGAITSVAVSPLDGSVLIGGMFETSGDPGGIFRSTDHGTTWERLPGLNGKSVQALVIAPSAPNTIYAGGSAGLFKSTDGGLHWASLGSSFSGSPWFLLITVDPSNSQIIYTSIVNVGLFRSVDGGATWQPIGAGINSDVRALVIDPGNQRVLYAGGAFKGVPGVYRSLDNGDNWEFFSTGMGSRDVTSLAFDRRSPQSLFAGSLAGIWKRTLAQGPDDFGVSVNAGALFTNSTSVTLSLTAPSGTSQMMLSNDGGFAGANWEPFQAQRAWALTSAGSTVLPRIVYAKFRTSGIISGLYQDDIILDQQSPTGTASIISPAPASAGAQAAPPQSLDAPHRLFLPMIARANTVQLRLRATDDLSGVGEMRLSSRSDFAGASWQPFATSATWDLPLQARVVYIQLRDRAMNVSSPILATYQTTAP